jgi:hypothetical protein
MWRKRKQLIIATSVVGLLAAAAPALTALAQSASPFGTGNPLDSLQNQIDTLKTQLQGLLNPPSPRNLTGDYAVVGNVDCVGYGPEFGPNLSVNLTIAGAATTYHQTFVGTMHYDGHGNGTEALSGMKVSESTNLNALPIDTFTATCPFTYAVSADGTYTETRPSCNTISTLTNGTTVTVTLTGNVRLQGRIVNGGKMLLFAGIEPDLETLTLLNGQSQRVCTRSSVATKIN